ncbi:reverse transcriptase domain-containing protein [Providencia sp. PROV273]|uniref:reverse transcriptase domain-containing protein n=1 Tax=Providencia sp. PROV273 TaxID=2949960 RepID=UPI00234BB2FC|nr:reverse transcriptase domain-containing protein [Providencia sp. PROV273]
MLLNKKYNKLLPTKDFLSDEVILLNAWKKSQQHIRTISSYADYFDLDKSALELDTRIFNISQGLKKKKLQLSHLKLIPAPKSYPWEFVKTNLLGEIDPNGPKLSWRPIQQSESEKNNKIPLIPMRPLAHISIEDQTLFTALMMLLANKTETIQGDPSTPFSDVHEKNIINYGNRLHCKYINDEASYSWGNSNTYSKFFQDYQQFLARPIHFGREAKRVKTSKEEIYEIHLDFSKFYDSIDRNILNEKISSLIEDITGEEPDECLKHVLQQFEQWSWTENSYELYDHVCKNQHIESLRKGKGVPQGLVSGGFFANIYLLKFDQFLSKLIGQYLDEESSVLLIDACRYVDDLRIIIKANIGMNSEAELGDLITKKLDSYTSDLNLRLQSEKTKVKKFSAKEGAVSAKLAGIQSKVSGPMTFNELSEQLGHLEGLIELSDNLNSEVMEDSQLTRDFTSQLALIDKTFNDVRKDTLLRFTANKMHTLLRDKRNMIAQEVNQSGVAIPGEWDYLQERIARKLISKWTKDPSLILLLKKGLELFPHLDLLRPIILNLEELQERQERELVIFSEYCLSEILRHSATIIHTKERWALPAHAQPKEYFEYLENYATDKIGHLSDLSEAFREQILFFCLIRNDSALDKPTGIEPFDLITQLVNGFRNVNLQLSPIDFVTAVLFSYQVGQDKDRVLRSILYSFNVICQRRRQASLSRTNFEDICERIIISAPELFEELFLKAKKMNLSWVERIKKYNDYLGLSDHSKVKGKLSLYNSKSISLLSVLRTDNNPFSHENGILKLLQSILTKIDKHSFSEPINIVNTKVECSNWDTLLYLDSSSDLNVELEYYNDKDEMIHSPPSWLTEEHEPLYYIGMFIRSCLLGKVDWTSSSAIFNNKSTYKGIKSNLLKRQVGMMHSPEAFGDSKSPMSDWLSTLLFKLLQWPGVESNGNEYSWPKSWNLNELEKCINNRIKEQGNSFLKQSKIPTYTEKVKLAWHDSKKHLNVIMVQSLLPLVKDFDTDGLQLDTPKYRAKHRRHVASVAELILHNIASIDSVNNEPNWKGKADLIVWPELSVSTRDIDILERLSDKTGAIIFSGVGFSHINNKRDLNNAAIWIIPNKGVSGRRFIKRLQGKENMTTGEHGLITPWRPYQLIIELIHPAFKNKEGFKITGSICYDATDIKLSADLKGKSHAYIVSAMNKDIATFDSMADALFYHMYQHIVLVNSGEFGGSVAKAPYRERYDKLITHTHGAHQVSISMFKMNMFDFREHGKSMRSNKPTKTPPAGNTI